MHDLQLTTMVTICKACEGSSIDRNLLSTLAEKVSLNALKATEQIYIAMSLLYSGGKVLLKMHDDAGKKGAEPQAIFSHSTIRVAPH